MTNKQKVILLFILWIIIPFSTILIPLVYTIKVRLQRRKNIRANKYDTKTIF